MAERNLNDQQRTRLLEEQATLQRASVDARQAAETVELDQTRQGRLSRMDAMQQQAMAQAARQRSDKRLRDITAALRRLEDGEYGECQDCGEAIQPARLVFDPCATLCIRCATQREG